MGKHAEEATFLEVMAAMYSAVEKEMEGSGVEKVLEEERVGSMSERGRGGNSRRREGHWYGVPRLQAEGAELIEEGKRWWWASRIFFDPRLCVCARLSLPRHPSPMRHFRHHVAVGEGGHRRTMPTSTPRLLY